MWEGFTSCALQMLSWINQLNGNIVIHGLPPAYRIFPVIRRSFLFVQNNPKDLDPSCKMDLDFLGCLGRAKLIL